MYKRFPIILFLFLILLAGCAGNSEPTELLPSEPPTLEPTPNLLLIEKLVKAAWDCDEVTIRMLLSDEELNVDAKNEFGTTALMAVSQNGCTDLVELLIKEYGANINVDNNHGRTALMLADYSSFSTMELLVLNGADVNAKNKYGATTLMLVAGSYDNFLDVTRLLINNGADVNAKDNDGKTAVDYARDSLNPDKTEIIQLLQETASK